jgi:hypothetical protein
MNKPTLLTIETAGKFRENLKNKVNMIVWEAEDLAGNHQINETQYDSEKVKIGHCWIKNEESLEVPDNELNEFFWAFMEVGKV